MLILTILTGATVNARETDDADMILLPIVGPLYIFGYDTSGLMVEPDPQADLSGAPCYLQWAAWLGRKLGIIDW